MTEFLTREQILQADDLNERVAVDVPEWKGQVMVKMLTGKERDRLDELALTLKGKMRYESNLKNVRGRFVAACVCDANGAKLFGEHDIEALGKKSAAALDRVYEAAAKLNRFTKEDVEELVGNSEGDQSAEPGSI